MSFVLEINYDQSANFTFNSTVVEFDPPLTRLKLISLSGLTYDQDFSSSTGFTLDPTLTEVAGGQLKQISQYGNATAVARYDSTIDLTDGGGTLTGTGFGAPVITGNKLDLTGDVERYVSYDGTGNVDSAIQTGAVKFKFTPNYNGSPATDFNLFCLSKAVGDTDNKILLIHKDAGGGGADQLRMDIVDSTGTDIINNFDFGTFVAVSGTEYEFELNWDITTGATRLFIDGVQLGATETSTGTRDNLIDLFRVGEDPDGGGASDGFFADFMVFPTVQHTANYTPGYTLPASRFRIDVITLPSFVSPFPGALEGFTGFSTVQSGNIQFNVDGMYWDGGAWAISDDSSSEMNDAATINSNIATLPQTGTTTVKARTQNTNDTQFVDDLTITFDAEGYSPFDPTVLQNSTVLADELEGFVETTASKPSGSDIKYTIVLNSQQNYFDGANWVNSDGTFLQSNTAAEIESNKTSLDISSGANLKVNAFLHSDDGSVTPTLTTVTVSYSFFINPTNPPECLVYGWALDMEGNGDLGATISAFVPGNGGFFHGNNLVFVQSETTADVNGYWEMSLVETETIGKSIRFNIVNSEGLTQEKETFIDVIIPDQASCAFNDIVNA